MSEALVQLSCFTRVVDETFVFGSTEDHHDQNVIAFFERCRQRGIQHNKDTFVFNQTYIEFAGLHFSKDGFKIHKDIVQAFADFPEPSTVTEMRRFQGLVNQLAPFASKIAKKLAPLRHFLKGINDKFALNDGEKRAIKDAKSGFHHPPSWQPIINWDNTFSSTQMLPALQAISPSTPEMH